MQDKRTVVPLNTVYRETAALHPVSCGLKIKGSGLTCTGDGISVTGD